MNTVSLPSNESRSVKTVFLSPQASKRFLSFWAQNTNSLTNIWSSSEKRDFSMDSKKGSEVKEVLTDWTDSSWAFHFPKSLWISPNFLWFHWRTKCLKISHFLANWKALEPETLVCQASTTTSRRSFLVSHMASKRKGLREYWLLNWVDRQMFTWSELTQGRCLSFSFFHASIKKGRIHTFINLKCPTGQVLVQHEEIRIEVMQLLSHLSILSSQQHIAAVHQIFERVPRAQTKFLNLVSYLSTNNRGAVHSQKLRD